MEIIYSGSTRIVFLIGRYAVKIPKCFVKAECSFYGHLIGFLNGWKANRTEYIWSKSNIFDFLLPVKFSSLGSLIIIMDKVDLITVEEFCEIDINNYNFSHEHKLDSYGKLNNKIYVIDYGN